MLLNIPMMCQRLLFILPIILSVSSIKVPVEKDEPATEIISVIQEEPKSTPIYYLNENPNLDSYLVRSDTHNPEHELPDNLGTPATYLIPPLKEQKSDFYNPSEPSAQSDWLPILQMPLQNQRNSRFLRPPVESIPLYLNLNQQGAINHQEGSQINIPVPVPSTQLVPPAVDAINEYFVPILPQDTEIHVDEHNQPIPRPNYNLPIYEDSGIGAVNPTLELPEPTLTLHLTPPRQQNKLNIPTKLYPKKYSGGFKPVPIPLDQLSNEETVPKAKPAKYFRPQPLEEVVQFKPSEEKQLYHFQKAENKRKLKGEEETNKENHSQVGAEAYGRPSSNEQETSETNFRYPGRNVYPALIRQAPPSAAPSDGNHPVAPASDGRTEFRMHGMKGPHSYQFGYDTGKGKNRQFRYEERDNDGLVHGHYGYMDKLGKLRVVNYSAHPEYGFRAEEPVTKEE